MMQNIVLIYGFTLHLNFLILHQYRSNCNLESNMIMCNGRDVRYVCVCEKVRRDTRHKIDKRQMKYSRRRCILTSKITNTKCSTTRSHNRLSMKQEEGALYSHPLSSLTNYNNHSLGECGDPLVMGNMKLISYVSQNMIL